MFGAPLVIITFIVWGLGLVGLLLGWWKEKQGGFLSLACFILVFILSLLNREGRSALRPMLVFSIPSVLFIFHWLMTPETMPPGKAATTLMGSLQLALFRC